MMSMLSERRYYPHTMYIHTSWGCKRRKSSDHKFTTTDTKTNAGTRITTRIKLKHGITVCQCVYIYVQSLPKRQARAVLHTRWHGIEIQSRSNLKPLFVSVCTSMYSPFQDDEHVQSGLHTRYRIERTAAAPNNANIIPLSRAGYTHAHCIQPQPHWVDQLEYRITINVHACLSSRIQTNTRIRALRVAHIRQASTYIPQMYPNSGTQSTH